MSESTRSKSGTAGSGTRTKDQGRSDTSGQKSSRGDGKSAGGGSDLSAQGQEMIGQAQEQAQSLVNTAREQATSQLMSQKSRAADSVTSIAIALQAASREMRNQDNTAIAGYIETAADQVEQFATALNDQDISQLMKTTEQFARRQPALFLAGAFALGFAGTRFLRSSSSSSGRMSQGDDYWQSQDRSDWQPSGAYGSSSAFGSRGGYGSSGSYGSTSNSMTGSGRAGSAATSAGSYGSAAASGDETRFTGSGGTKANREWQSSTGFNSGPEGQ